jgi:hypothetical protein
VNLYALRATNPDDLLTDADPIGPENVDHLERWLASDEVAVAVAGWGAWQTNMPWERRIARPAVEQLADAAGRDLTCLGRTKFGAPRHPLYVAKTQPLISFAARIETKEET